MEDTEQPKSQLDLRELRLSGREDEAELLAQELLAAPSIRLSALKEAAYLAFHRKDWNAAWRRYQRLLDVSPSAFSDKYYRRLYQAYCEAGETDRAVCCLMDAMYLFPEDPVFKPAGQARHAEIAARAERWTAIITRTGPTAQAAQALLFKQLFTGGDAIAAHQLKQVCAETYRRFPVEGMLPSQQYQRAAASSYLEHYAEAREWLSNQNWMKWGKDRWVAAQLLGYCDIAVGADPKQVFNRLFRLEHGDSPAPANTNADWGVAEFDKIFRNKSVAIVGPANTGQVLRDEIDGFDVVVRTNVFSFEELARAKDRLGMRADVSYYTNSTFQLRRQELYGLLSSSTLIPVLRRGPNLREARSEAGIRNARLSSPTPRNFLPIFGSMHAVQRIIWDLSKFSPSRIKLFNANFYGGALYDPSYTPRKAAPDRKSLGVSHDPLQGFIFAKTMFEQGVIEADPVASEILGWSRWQYIDMLQREFADHWR